MDAEASKRGALSSFNIYIYIYAYIHPSMFSHVFTHARTHVFAKDSSVASDEMRCPCSIIDDDDAGMQACRQANYE